MADRRWQTIATLITIFQVVWQIICLPDELLSAFLRAYLIIFLCLHHPDNKQLYNPDNSYVKYQLKSLKAQKYAL